MAGVVVPTMQQKKDPLDTVMKGLAIASSVYGIKADMAKTDALEAETKRKNDGVLSPEEEVAMAKDFKQVPIGTEGSLERTVRGKRVAFLPDKASKSSLVKMTTAGKDGKPVTNFITPQEGVDYAEYVKPDDRGAERAETRNRSAFERKQRELNSDVGKLQDIITASEEVTSIAQMAQTNPVAAQNLGAKLARAAGEKGVLTDADVERYGGSRSVQAKLERYLQRSIDGTITAEDVKFANDFAVTMREATERKIYELEVKYAKQHTDNYGGEFKENYAIITGRDYVDLANNKNTKNKDDEIKISSQEAMEELARRGINVPTNKTAESTKQQLTPEQNRQVMEALKIKSYQGASK